MYKVVSSGYKRHKILLSKTCVRKSLSLKNLAIYAYLNAKLFIIFYVLNKSVKSFHVKRFLGQHKTLGNTGEAVAKKYYENKGFLILSSNFRTRNSEIDFVARKVQTLVFVEVKSLEIGSTHNLLAEDNFTWQKRKHFKRAIEQYLLKEKPAFKNLQIDLACVYYHTNGGQWTIKLYENIILE